MHPSHCFDDSFRTLGRRALSGDRLYSSIAPGCLHLGEENHGYRGDSEGSERAKFRTWKLRTTVLRPWMRAGLSATFSPHLLAKTTPPIANVLPLKTLPFPQSRSPFCLTCHHFFPLLTLSSHAGILHAKFYEPATCTYGPFRTTASLFLLSVTAEWSRICKSDKCPIPWLGIVWGSCERLTFVNYRLWRSLRVPDFRVGSIQSRSRNHRSSQPTCFNRHTQFVRKDACALFSKFAQLDGGRTRADHRLQSLATVFAIGQ